MWLKLTYTYYVYSFVVYTLVCKQHFCYVSDVILVSFNCSIKDIFSSCQATDLLCYLGVRLWVLSFNINGHNKRAKQITF